MVIDNEIAMNSGYCGSCTADKNLTLLCALVYMCVKFSV